MTKEMRLPIPVVAIGAGRVALAAHLRELRDLPDVLNLVAVVEVDPHRADVVRQIFPDRVYGTIDEAIALGAEAALCLTPWWTHREIVEACLHRRIPVLCEKPVSLDPADISSLIDAERRTGVPVAVGYMKRHDPAVQRFITHVQTHLDSARRITVEIQDPNAPHQVDRLVPVGLPAGRRSSQEQVAAVARALGAESDLLQREVFSRGLGGSLVHQVNIVHEAMRPAGLQLRGKLRHSAQWARGSAVTCCWQPKPDLLVQMSHMRLPSHGTYRETIEFVGEDSIATLEMPCPYVRDRGATLQVRDWVPGDGGAAGMSYTSAPGRAGFRAQLLSWATSLAGVDHDVLPGLDDALLDVLALREAALAVEGSTGD